MSKSSSAKAKPLPWIPAGNKGIPQYKKCTKVITIVKKKKGDHISTEMSPKVLPEWKTVEDSPKKETKLDTDADMMSLSSHSSYEFETLNQENELDIYHISLLREMKLLYVHFASLKTSYISAHRLIDFQEIEDDSINELLTEAGSFLKTLNSLFDDLEYSVSVLENTLNENQKKVEFSTVLKNKEKLLTTLLSMYEKVIVIFQVVFEKHDYKELSRALESVCEKLKIADKRCLSQEAVITDLERRLSIYQSKTAAMESYKTNLEAFKVELEKKLLQKESQIKYLNNELMNASNKYSKSDREDFIEIIENVKSKAHDEKSALKKALRFSKTQCKEKDETNKKLLEEASEKEKIMFDLAAQRDQLKIQLTVVNNNTIQLRQQIEEMKIQNSKLQNEMTEKDISHKKEMSHLKCAIEEKSTELDESLKKKKKLEETVEDLENELSKSEELLKYFKDKSDFQKHPDLHTSNEIDTHESIPQLVALLQSTRETFENLIHSGFVPSSGDHITENVELSNNQKKILTAVSEVKRYILELRNKLLAFLQEQNDIPEVESPLRKNDLETEMKKMEHMYKSVSKENELLKQKLKSLKNSNLVSSNVQNAEDSFPTYNSNDNLARNFQVELYKKDKEIASLKFELAHQKEDFENQLRELKDKSRLLEIDNMKIANLEEELKNAKVQLSVIQKKKEEETASLLQRAQELQESLDKKTDKCRDLEQYIQLIKVSYYRVFGNS